MIRSELPSGRSAVDRPARILVVEDDRKAVAFLRKGLVEGGYAVDAAATGDDGLARALTAAYALSVSTS